MKRTGFLKLLAAVFILMIPASLWAAPGDTTWVTVYNLRKLTHYGNYDTVAVFPAKKQYRKIRLHYILGRYSCPPGSQYCGSWDYTTRLYLLPPAHDSVEIARVITPFATDWLSKNKSHDYVVEVTDYSSQLHDTTGFRFRYEGYSWGFTITLKLEFIEGVPPREALDVKNIYDGYFAYGNASDPIENHLSSVNLMYTSPQAAIKNFISGHGADNTGCSEFCSKYYRLFINNNQHAQKQIWRDDCGLNQVYPQTGTWIFDRSNWCPGAVVWPIYHSLDMVTAPNTTFTADINMEPYVNATPSAGYNFASQLISYSDFNHTVDASIEDIISPTSDPNYFRDNPACSNPVIKVKNTGRDPIVQMAIEYGLTGRTLSTYTHVALLDPLQEEIIVLPPVPAVMAHSVNAPFEARIVWVGGQNNDENPYNNVYVSQTQTVELMPRDFILRMSTNGSAAGGWLSENSWRLYDGNDQLIASRTTATINGTYRDTIRDLADGCYRLEVSDAGCDGFNWWYFQYYTPNPGIGTVRIDNITGTPRKAIPGDIGCGYNMYFYVGDYPQPPDFPNHPGFAEHNILLLETYPSPASEQFYIAAELNGSHELAYSILDMEGRVLDEKKIGKSDQVRHPVHCENLAPGVYLVKITLDGKTAASKKVIVAR